MIKKYTFLLLALILNTFLYSQTEKANWEVKWNYTAAFIENKGQFDGRTGQATQIQYAVDYNGLNMFFTKEGITYRFDKFIRNPERTSKSRHEPKRICLSELVSVSWLDANNNVELIASEKIHPYYSYAFNDTETGSVKNENFINGYNTLLYKNLYENVDVEYICYPGQGIKYNLYLAPGADVSQIKMKYEGFHNKNKDEKPEFELTPEGTMRIKGSYLDITELKLVAYYAGNDEVVDISFTFNNDIVGFDIKNYDNTRTLVIDPWIVSPTFTNSNAVWEVETDAAGNIYVIGGESPMKLNKYNSSGALQWSYTTPWDTAGYWLGTLATDNSGISYITAGTSPKIQKISTAGSMVWNNAGPNASCEYWSIIPNCDTTRLIVGGTFVPFVTGFTFSSAVYDIALSDGSVLGFHTFDTVEVMMGPGVTPIEIRGISSSKNSKCNFITHNSVGLISQNIGQYTSNVLLYKTPLTDTLGYKCENYLPYTQNGGGLKAIISNNNFVYTHGGNQIHKRDLATGALITSVNLPGGQSGISLGLLIVKNCGLDVDDCGNVYAGSGDRIVKFDQNLNVLAQEMTGFTVYDLNVNANGEVVAVGAVSNNTSANRNGKILSVNMSACAQYEPSCCDATIFPVNPICHNASPFNLVAGSAGGTWSGTGIINTSSGTFDPLLAGIGNHIIVYTLPCGSDSITVGVYYCATLTPCLELNGNISVSGGIAPYTWQEWIPAGTYPITNQAECTTCGYTWNTLTNQCMNGMFPITTCNASAHWANFASGYSTPPPSQFPVRVLDFNGNFSIIDSLATLPACVPCATLSLSTLNINNTGCIGGSDGSFLASVSGGAPPYILNLTLGGNTIASFNNILSAQTFTGLTAGVYTLNVFDTDSCILSTTVTIGETPFTISASGNSPVCEGQTINLTASGGSVYTWTGPQGFSSNLQNPSITNASPANNGTYKVIISSPPCIDSITVNVYVHLVPIAVAGNSQTISSGTSTTLNGSATGGSGNYSYTWTPANLLQNANTQNPTTLPLTYSTTFTLVVTDIVTGCQVSDNVNIIVLGGVLYASVNASPSVICQGTQATLNALPSGGSGIYTYSWVSNPSGFTSSLQNPSVSPNVTTIYTVNISDGSQSASASVLVQLNPLPLAAGSISGPAVVYQGQTGVSYSVPPVGNASNYIWAFPQGINVVSGNNTNSIIVDFTANATSGIFTVYGHNSCGYGLGSPVFPVTIITSIDELNTFSINLYPNPTKGIITIEMNSIPHEQLTMKIYNIIGDVVFEKVLENKQKQSFLFNDFANGLYFVKISSNKFNIMEKLIISKTQ